MIQFLISTNISIYFFCILCTYLFITFRMSILEDHMKHIEQPPEIEDKYWDIIKRMISFNPSERTSLEEVCIYVWMCIYMCLECFVCLLMY
jgi:hypothetical protein